MSLDKRIVKIDDIEEFKEFFCYGNPKYFQRYDTCQHNDKNNNIDCDYLHKRYCFNTEQTKVRYKVLEDGQRNT